MSCTCSMKPTPPPLTNQIATFGKALVAEAGAILHGQEPVTAAEQHARMSICISCNFYDQGKCLLCGCDMNRKTGFRTAHCADNPPQW
jgi:hypothetical protein